MRTNTVVRTYYVVAGLYTLSAALIWGVNTLFLLDAGLDILEVFIANAAFTAGMTMFEIPTGVLADTAGRRLSFLLSVVVLFVTTLAYVWAAEVAAGLTVFVAVSVFMGLGFTFYSGAVEAWLVDALQSTGFTGSLDRVFARGSMVTGAAMLAGTAAGGFLGSIDLSVPYFVRAGLLAAAAGAAFFMMHDVGFTPRAFRIGELPAEMRRVAAASIRYGWQHRSVRLLMMISCLQYGFLTWAFYAWPPYFLELLGRDAVWVAGVVASLIALSTIVGNALVDWFSQFCGKRTTLIYWAAGVQTVAAVGVGLADSFWLALTFLLFVTAGMGVVGPVKQAYVHQLIPSEHRASVVSFDSMVGNGGGILGQSGLGYLSRAQSIDQGYVVGGLATALALPLVASLRARGDEADVIVGVRAGQAGPCAAQGLPQIGQLDTASRQDLPVLVRSGGAATPS